MAESAVEDPLLRSILRNVALAVWIQLDDRPNTQAIKKILDELWRETGLHSTSIQGHVAEEIGFVVALVVLPFHQGQRRGRRNHNLAQWINLRLALVRRHQ